MCQLHWRETANFLDRDSAHTTSDTSPINDKGAMGRKHTAYSKSKVGLDIDQYVQNRITYSIPSDRPLVAASSSRRTAISYRAMARRIRIFRFAEGCIQYRSLVDISLLE